VTYWDPDNDNIIWPGDTYTGVRKWGWLPPLALLVTFIIHFNLSYPTVPGWFPDPFFRVYVQNLHKDKHGSDSMTFDNEGRFRPQQFEDLFEKYDEGDKGGLDAWDVVRMIKGQRLVMDFFGWFAAIFECKFALSLLHYACGLGEVKSGDAELMLEQGLRHICSYGLRMAL
jgi:peroxygenase